MDNIGLLKQSESQDTFDICPGIEDHFKLAYSRFIIQLSAIELTKLPLYKGSTIRGAFGHAFRAIVCTNRLKPCHECQQNAECAYARVFETVPPPDSEIMRNYPNVPHLFIIEPPLNGKKDFLPDELIEYQLILLEPALKYLPIFILAFERMGHQGLGADRGRFQLKRVFEEGSQSERLIYSSTDRIIKDHLVKPKLLSFPKPKKKIRKIRVTFLTPTRLKYGNKLVSTPEFQILLTNLLRRISLLNYFYGNQENPKLNYRGIIDSALSIKIEKLEIKWQDWERYSSRQKRKIQMGGLVGNVDYFGEINPYLPLLKMGEIIHIGKGAVFGLGKYQIQVLEEGINEV
jgi:hypothetical protein